MIDQHRDGMNAIVINLARRSQLLVEQQLHLLHEMQREERDPARLAALFRVDHLAARLRRQDENLLVLAGGQPRRRVGAGLSLDGLVLAAVSEVEQYHRLRPEFDVSGQISGPATADLVHLLAELVENAIAFSPPDSSVRILSTKDGGEAVIEITDEGIGLSPGALAEANEMLEFPPELDLAASERMGLVVVSHLAARHRVRVRLRSSHTGTTATVRIPGELWRIEGEA
jgi:signal transduction histidine kinase